jgi:hypothetical protein
VVFPPALSAPCRLADFWENCSRLLAAAKAQLRLERLAASSSLLCIYEFILPSPEMSTSRLATGRTTEESHIVHTGFGGHWELFLRG